MITVAIFNFIVVFFSFLAKDRRSYFPLETSFILIFLFLALRYDYGNDYFAYLNGFQEINSYAIMDYFDKSWNFEIGWIFLCRMFKPLGFFAMTAFLAFFNCFVYYRFIKKHVPYTHYWVAVFLYVFSPGFMLIHSSAMRQSVAISLFIFSINYLYKKDAIRYFICIGIAALFHTSALMLIPVYLLGIINWNIGKVAAPTLFSLFILFFLYGDLFSPYLNSFINNYFGKYTVYEGAAEIGTGLGLVIYSSLFALILFYSKIQISEVSLLFKIAIISYFFMPIGLLIMMVGRVGMYFSPATIVVFPLILNQEKNKVFNISLLALLIFITLYNFFVFFQSDVWRDAFGTYQTIFSAPEIY